MSPFSPHSSPSSWWVEVHTAVPQQIYHLGSFESREAAKVSRGAHVEALQHQKARDVVALLKQR